MVREIELLRQELWDLAQIQHDREFLKTDVESGAKFVEVDFVADGRREDLTGLHVLCLMHAIHLGQELVRTVHRQMVIFVVVVVVFLPPLLLSWMLEHDCLGIIL